jgi:membrane protease YdiL (CAAX protease family)
MSTLREETSISKFHMDIIEKVSMKTKLLAILEVLLVFAAMMSLDALWRSTGIVQWENQNLGWSYTGMLTYDPAIGLSSLAWGWALWSSVGGLLFGVIREKTGTLVAPGIAHGLPDAVGLALSEVFGWMWSLQCSSKPGSR